MSQWVRLWEDTPGPPNLSDLARRVLSAAVDNCAERRSPCPQWLAVPIAREDETAFCDAFQELCDARIVAEGVLARLRLWKRRGRLAGYTRPSAAEWQDLRRATFERDDYTCQYCGQHGGKLECDHIFPFPGVAFTFSKI